MKAIISSGQIPRNMVNADYEFHHYRTSFQTVPLHFHDFYEIYFLLSDSATYLVNGRYYQLTKGDILLISPQEMHSVVRAGSTNGLYERVDLYIRPAFFAQHSREDANLQLCFERCNTLPTGNLLRPKPALAEAITSLFADMHHQADSQDFGASLLHEILPLRLLVYLNQASLDCRTDLQTACLRRCNSPVDALIAHIESHLGEPLSLESLAERAHISKYHLVRLFREQTGLTPIQYVRYRRLLRARSLLQENKSVTAVCQECGFSDYSNFIRAFKAQFGLSPGRYAREEREKRPPRFETLLLAN